MPKKSKRENKANIRKGKKTAKSRLRTRSAGKPNKNENTIINKGGRREQMQIRGRR